MKNILLTSLIAIASAISFKRIQPYFNAYFDKELHKSWDYAERYFSADYYDARALFRHHATSHNLEMHSIPLDVPDHDDLTIDVAIFRGKPKKVLIHISGTHGVEGFAGSAVQSSVLGGEKTEVWKLMNSNPSNHPTVVFIHALNPYGFAKLRRWNENNVDLNRNFLNPNKFKERIALDPNRHGYVDFYNLFNPTSALPWNDFYLVQAMYHIVRYGYVPMKKCLVTGTYHHPKGIFYDGVELQQSHKLLSNFLKKELNIEELERVGLVDVHTGLGPKGFDTLMSETEKATLLSIFRDDDNDKDTEFEKHIAAFGTAGSAGSGYDDVVGEVPKGVGSLLPSSTSSILITQEFGTANPILVSQALREENAAYWHAPWKRIGAAQRVRGVFYLHNDPQWKADVVTRGADVFWKLHKHLE